MTIKRSYFELLEHVGATVPLVELAQSPHSKDLVGLRHDVGHDLDLALEMANLEHARGIRATYFLLHTATYVEDDLFIDKCLQLQDYGHEVGLHLNVLTPWFDGETDDPIGDLEAWLSRVRAAGVILNGSSVHGDRACYQHDFINYWIWSELRGKDPAGSEDGLTAEGVPMDDNNRCVSYPPSHSLMRGDGETFPLWSVSMESLGLSYEACRVPHDQYWSDSGGSWKRSVDPMEHDLSQGRHQLLTQPIWWRDAQRIVFVVSTARSGSRWLTEQFHRASSADARHEWTLNEGSNASGEYVGKRTSGDLRFLENHPTEVERLLGIAVKKIRHARKDFVECNVYLTHWVDVLKRLCPEAEFVHLYREHSSVIRSLIGRGWYGTCDDRSHPTVEIAQWSNATRFQRVCHYWVTANRNLIEHVPEENRIASRDLFDNESAFGDLVEQLGFVTHPRLLHEEYAKPLNQASESTVELAEAWPEFVKGEMGSICEATSQLLSGVIVDPPHSFDVSDHMHRIPKSHKVKVGRGSGQEAKAVYRVCLRHGLTRHVLPIVKRNAECTGANSHVCLLRGMSWTGFRPVNSPPLAAGAACLLDLQYVIKGSSSPVRMFVLCFGARGEVIARMQIAECFAARTECSGSVLLPDLTCQVGLAVHIGSQRAGFGLNLVNIDFRIVWNPEGYDDTCNAITLK